jgi:predicted homoserine dehydrogenase-like protein
LGISVASAALRNEPTGTSLDFVADVAATAKRDLKPGDVLDGEGGYTVFGKLIGSEESLAQGCLPLGLTGGAKVTRPVARGKHLTYTDVSLDQSGAAYKLRQQMEKGDVG